MIKISVIVILLAGFVAIGCSSGNNNDNGGFVFGKGKYKFKMSDSSGTEYLNGILNVKNYENGVISGTYEFKKISNDKFDGFSSMSGEFEGNVNLKEKVVFINTNPKIADSNVFWNMKIGNKSLYGSWQYSVFRGKTSGGKVKVYN
ncbi:MAG TPA: hypothetical protein PKD83_09755 [Ignavibacteria bacterium]|nr:hypothetical protein [Ignavibacteria bacterium]